MKTVNIALFSFAMLLTADASAMNPHKKFDDYMQQSNSTLNSNIKGLKCTEAAYHDLYLLCISHTVASDPNYSICESLYNKREEYRNLLEIARAEASRKTLMKNDRNNN
jgi:hypothetical protein